ncbi:hypothetical protein D3C87_2070600 [compost metagenome]
MLAQQVVDGEALEHVAARRIHVHRDRASAHATQRARNALGGHAIAAPVVVADDVIDADRAFVVLLGGRAHAGLPAIQRAGL